MNILIFTHELPFPAVHGGRIDTWNRIKALKELNHKIFLVAWAVHKDNSKMTSVKFVEKSVDELICYRRSINFLKIIFDKIKKLCFIFIQPNIVTECDLSGNKINKLYDSICDFDPQFVLSDGIYTGKIAAKVAKKLRLPFFIRTHNIEHIYVKQLIEDSKSLKTKLKFLAMSGNLKNYEYNILKSSNAFFDISLADLAFWKDRGFSNGYWMPPIHLPADRNERKNFFAEKQFDICYIGNLYSPNNLISLRWFFENVLPEIEKKGLTVRVLVAGFNPAKEFKKYCKNLLDVTLLSNPASLGELYENSKILINPILSGSGVNIKTVEMLYYNKPIVCTSQAISGLPSELAQILHIADDHFSFAAAIIKILEENKDYEQSAGKKSVRNYFGKEYFEKSISIMNSISQSGYHAPA